MLRSKHVKKILFVSPVLLLVGLAVGTYLSMQPVPDDLHAHINYQKKRVYTDRNGKRLNITYENKWNIHERVYLYDVPEFLQQAFIIAEDKRFFQHKGIDWLARLNAAWQNLTAAKGVRGASTISEQVIKMLHPRPRNIWTRWVEGFEAISLENKHSKLAILEFYINQVPYKARRRGIVQASRYYFDRDIDTLNKKEMLTLAVLVRAPRWFDPYEQPDNLYRGINNLAERMLKEGSLHETVEELLNIPFDLRQSDIGHNVEHFLSFVDKYNTDSVVATTLDLELQGKVQAILDNRLQRLQAAHVQNGAVLVVNHETNEILSWAVGYAGQDDKPFNKINSILSKRQPGSTLKPLLYTRAMLQGWTAATMLDDKPLEEGVGAGMHTYHNYSRSHYGLISVREALGNSLNIPAVKAAQYVGANNFLNFLQQLGIKSLSGHPNVYGDGLALGNGELSLYELVQAYTVLARMGDFKPLSHKYGEHEYLQSYRVYSEDIASLIADILSDPAAREKEFGQGSILNLPYQTAVKTGTSSDYRDAWAIGFNDKYTVGVWIGNLDYTEMREITGSSGPAWILRSVFNELNRDRDVRSLYLSEQLTKQRVCINTGLLSDNQCKSRDEWFVSGTVPQQDVVTSDRVWLRKPSKNLQMAMDPRIPDEYEYFEFALGENNNIKQVTWYLNDEQLAVTSNPVYQWRLRRGEHEVRAEVLLQQHSQTIKTETVSYKVN